MSTLYPRTVFFVADAARARTFYTQTLGFSLDWTHEEHGKPFVVQVSLMGCQIILNQTEEHTRDRAGRGRVFIGLDDDEGPALLRHLEQRTIRTQAVWWGAPTLVIHDLDDNEFFFWLPEKDRASLESRLSAS